MRERKALMEDRSDAFLVLPGGLRMHSKPVVLLNGFGFYGPLLVMIDRLRAAGFVRQVAMDALRVAADPVAALNVIEAGLPGSPSRRRG
jgi:predicted Rossmann-fold nucleotide-binding protein